ncbi:unnamed protein product [Owenia fusiformis]|uniref:MACPF domain-containing protein n=1 Tax=Owenia fusiformis TaxID=6347 RepID=A0A8S4NJV2_OWEFU|nr:unnamed protein product [Owenia fusiformis]
MIFIYVGSIYGTTSNSGRMWLLLTIACLVSQVGALEPLPDRATLIKRLDWIDSVSTQARACRRLPPGIPKLHLGYNLGYLDLLPFEAGRDVGERRNLVDFTCNENKTWVSPYNGRTYDLPDQLATLTTVPRGALTYDSYLWKSYNELTRTWTRTIGIEFLGGLFGFSRTKTRSITTIHYQKRFMEDVTSFVSGTRAEFHPPWLMQLSAAALDYYNRYLPNTYAANPDAYDTFCDLFGTHFFEAGQFGGLLKMFMDTEKDMVATFGDTKTKSYAEGLFMNWLKALGAHNRPNQNVDPNFIHSTREFKRFYGGSGNLADPNFYAKWTPTVPGNPKLFAGNVKPLTLLLPDRTKMAAMDQAIQVAFNKGRLDEMKRTLNYFISTLQNLEVTGSWSLCNQNTITNCHIASSGTSRSCLIGICQIPTFERDCTFSCQYKAWPEFRRRYIAEARSLIPRIDAQIRGKARNSPLVNTLYTQTDALLLKMDTASNEVRHYLRRGSRVCRCQEDPNNICSCYTGVGHNRIASLKAPLVFFRALSAANGS